MNGPINKIPDKLFNLFTLNNKIPIYDWYLEENNTKLVWSNQLIEDILKHYTIENILNDKHHFKRWPRGGEPYPDHRIGGACKLLQKSFSKYPIKNKNVAIIGSTSPWIESICLNNDVNKVTTVEYNIPKCNHNKLKFMNYYEEFKKCNEKFDCIVSYSSIEHSGLGRYGDIIDPEGDFKAINDIYNNLREEGLLYLGIPVGPDALVWNAHRIYGKIRLPLLLKKFKILKWFGCTFKESQKLPKGPDWKSFYQPVIVLKKI